MLNLTVLSDAKNRSWNSGYASKILAKRDKHPIRSGHEESWPIGESQLIGCQSCRVQCSFNTSMYIVQCTLYNKLYIPCPYNLHIMSIISSYVILIQVGKSASLLGMIYLELFKRSLYMAKLLFSS